MANAPLQLGDDLEAVERRTDVRIFLSLPGRFTLADIALFCIAEFGGSVGQKMPAECANLQRWFEATKARPSAKA